MEGLKFALLSGGTGYNDIAWNFQGYGLATADDRQGSKDVWQAFSYLYTVIYHPTAGYVLFDVGLAPGRSVTAARRSIAASTPWRFAAISMWTRA